MWAMLDSTSDADPVFTNKTAQTCNRNDYLFVAGKFNRYKDKDSDAGI